MTHLPSGESIDGRYVMEDVHGAIYITADAVRKALGSEPRPGVFYQDPPHDPVRLLGALIDAELVGLKRNLMNECIAEWALEAGMDDYLAEEGKD